jgi:hypothetical protein
VIQSRRRRKDFDGCLSFPGLYGQTIRPHRLRVTWLDRRGSGQERIFEDFDAVLVHHEIDHLDGVLFIDRIEKADDLYRIHTDEDGRQMRVPVAAGFIELSNERGTYGSPSAGPTIETRDHHLRPVS